MTEPSLVDWGLARSLGGAVARGEPADAWSDRPLRAREICDEALRRVLAYSTLEPTAGVPPAEILGREEWIRANVAGMRDLVAPLETRAAGELELPWPLGRIARGALGAAAGAEAGVAIGYAARRVLGQYHVGLTADPRPPRLLLIGSNLTHAGAEVGADDDAFLLWVAIHEQTHSVQFAAVPWLREHLADLVARLLAAAGAGVDLAALAALARRIVATDPRQALREAMRGELARALAGPEQAQLLDEVQAMMTLVEGYAEHLMDAAAADDPGLATMRERLDERRARRTGLADVIARALGLGMKLRQYELGKRFCDAVAGQAGIGALDRAWDSPRALPTRAELERPESWLDRVSLPASPAGA